MNKLVNLAKLKFQSIFSRKIEKLEITYNNNEEVNQKLDQLLNSTTNPNNQIDNIFHVDYSANLIRRREELCQLVKSIENTSILPVVSQIRLIDSQLEHLQESVKELYPQGGDNNTGNPYDGIRIDSINLDEFKRDNDKEC